MRSAMPPLTIYPQYREPPAALPSCPRCGGKVVRLRDQWRCRRCAFALCEECNGEPETLIDPIGNGANGEYR